jgi:hypothetical protein
VAHADLVVAELVVHLPGANPVAASAASSTGTTSEWLGASKSKREASVVPNPMPADKWPVSNTNARHRRRRCA